MHGKPGNRLATAGNPALASHSVFTRSQEARRPEVPLSPPCPEACPHEEDGRARREAENGEHETAIAYPYGVIMALRHRTRTPSLCGVKPFAAATHGGGKSAAAETRPRAEVEEGDCVFRYRLPDPAHEESLHANRLAEMLRRQLCNILEIAVPRMNGEDLAMDSFRFFAENKVYVLYPDKRLDTSRHDHAPLQGTPEKPAPLPGRNAACPESEGGEEGFAPHCQREDASSPAKEKSAGDAGYRSLENAALYEPRVEFIARQLASLLSVVELESGGRPVKVDAFRLRDLDDWTGPHASAPADVFQHAATRCQLHCVFCYNRGAPPTLRDSYGSADVRWEELSARLSRYRPRAGTGLFPTFGGPRELLAHPHALRLLREMRALTDAPFRLATNGAALDRETVAALAELDPVFLDLSLNSASPRRRAMLMGDPEPAKAIKALPMLAEAGIPFAVTIVAWPLPGLEEMLEDLRHTALYADAWKARMVQVNLPGFSRFFSPSRPFDTARVWPEIVREAQRLRREVGCPVFVSPAMYEENLTRPVKNRAEVIGTVPGSPAARAGLAAGDLITAVNGVGVSSRPQARDLLSRLEEGDVGEFSLRVKRGGKEVEIAGHTHDYAYPYDPQTAVHLGAVFMGSGFRASHLDKVQTAIQARGALRPLLLTSALVRPTLEQLLRERPLSLPEGCSLSLGVPETRYFGGNIILGDLLVVEDFVAFIREFEARHGARPDLALIPSSPFHLSGWGRDLTGRPYVEIERRTGVAVELLRCETIWE